MLNIWPVVTAILDNYYKLLRDHPMIIFVQFWFNMFSNFYEKTFITFPIGYNVKLRPTWRSSLISDLHKNHIPCNDHPRIIHTKLYFKPLIIFGAVELYGSFSTIKLYYLQLTLAATSYMLNFELAWKIHQRNINIFFFHVTQ